MVAGWRNWRRWDWLPIVLGGALFFGVLSALSLAADIGQPFGGFIAVHHFTTDDWSMDSVTPRYWPVVTEMGLRDLDYLRTIDGLPVGRTQRQIYVAAAQRGQSTVQLGIERDGQPLTLNVPLVYFTLPDFLDLKLPNFVTALGFWLVAVVIYRARRAETLNRVFALTAVLLAGWLWLPQSELFLYSGQTNALITLVWGLSVTLLAAFALHAAFLFPTTLRRGRRLIPVIYAIYAVMAVFYATVLIWRWLQDWPPLLFQLDMIGFRFATFSLMGCALVFFIRLIWSAWYERSIPRVRNQLAIILVGMGVTLLPMAIAFTGALSGSSRFFVNGLDMRYLLLTLPLAFAYVIVRYQTFRSSPPPLFIGVMVLITAILIASVGDWAIRSLFPDLRHSAFVPLLAVALLVGGLWSSQGLFQQALRRVFHWEETSYRAVRQFGQAVVSQPDLAQLPHTIVNALVAELKVEQAAIWLAHDTGDQFDLAAQAGRSVVQLPDRLTLPLALLKPLRAAQAGLGDLSARGIEALALLIGVEKIIGVLGLGKRWDEEIFRDRDFEIVELIAQQAALFLLTARQIDELRQVPRRVSEAQERERFKIAQELHDTIQQFLGRLPFFLEVSRSLAHDDPTKADELLQRSIEDVEQAAKTVRQIRANLAPFQLQTSFVQPVQELIDRFQARQHLDVQYTIAPDLDAYLSLEARHALYRVVQQALDNTAEHAQAKRISIALAHADHRVTVDIDDDGVGSAVDDRAQAEAQGSFGLRSMRDRIEAQGGMFEIVSSPGQGTVLRGWVPIGDTPEN
jgi:signal transduction histidine kinase